MTSGLLDQKQVSWLKNKIRNVSDFPRPGVLFRDLTTLLADHEAFELVVNALVRKYKPMKPDYIAGVEARGFIFGATLAYTLGAGFLTIRKPGKLPFTVERVDYELEYGMDALEICSDVLESAPKNPKVVLVDDLLATGGTASAAVSLLEKLGSNILGVGCVVELAYLNGRAKFSPNIDVLSLITYDQ